MKMQKSLWGVTETNEHKTEVMIVQFSKLNCKPLTGAPKAEFWRWGAGKESVWIKARAFHANRFNPQNYKRPRVLNRLQHPPKAPTLPSNKW